MTEHVCQHPIYSHNGAPIRCSCGHFSAAALELDDERTVCHDCATEVLRAALDQRRQQRATVRAIRASTCGVCSKGLPADDRLPFATPDDGLGPVLAHAACAVQASIAAAERRAS